MSAKTGRAEPPLTTPMNSGAEVARGDILFFLHADTLLPAHWDLPVRSALKDRSVTLGAFRFYVKERLRGIFVTEWLTYLRSRYLQRPYGDQGFFMRSEVFDALGGYPEQPLLEDVEMAAKARRCGRIVTLREPATTSGRRWQKLGVFRGSMINHLVMLGHAIGLSPETLARFYK